MMRLDRRGLTLVELLVTLTVFSIVMASAIGFFTVQQQAFQKGAEDLSVAQNLSFGLSTLAQEIRSAGANVPGAQPSIVYAGPGTFAFSADLTTNVAHDPFAIFYDPDAPAGQVTSLRLADQITIPGSAPARAWPLQNYLASDGSASAAETIIFWFQPDTETARPDDYRLMHQVNNGTPQLVARNILAPSDTSQRFFSYRYLYVPTTGRQTLQPVPNAWLPLAFGTARTDSIRVVTVSYRVTNALPGARERIQVIRFAVGLPDVGLTNLQQCGDPPVYSGSLTAAWSAPDNGVALAFPASADEASGEKDVVRYVVYRRLAGATDWGDPYLSIPIGSASYTYLDQAVTPSTSYEYAVSAQDCTPRLSAPLTSGPVAVP